MKKVASIAFVGTVLLAPAMANAQAYVGLGFGKAHSSVADDFLSPNLVKRSDTVYKFTAGYELTDNWAVEGGYADFGKIESRAVAGSLVDSDVLKARAFYIAAVGSLPIDNQFSVFGKFGLSSARAKLESTYTMSGTVYRDAAAASKSSAMFGFGAQYKFNKNMSAVVEYEDFGKVCNDVNVTTGWKMRTLTIGARYKF